MRIAALIIIISTRVVFLTKWRHFLKFSPRLGPKIINGGRKFAEVNVQKSISSIVRNSSRVWSWYFKGGEKRDTKILNLLRNIVSLQGLVGVSRFSPCLMNLARNKNICCGLKKCGALIGWFARARANLSRDKLWVWWKTSNKAKLCCSK